MADVKISGLPLATSLDGTELSEVVQGGGNKRAPQQLIANLFKGTKGADIASAATTDIGAATGLWVHVTGTTTITALGTVAAGALRLVTFDGVLTLTHNATSLVLPGGANIQTQAGDCAIFESEGTGNWRCVLYAKVSGQGLPKVFTLTDGATISVDASVADNFRVVLGGNRTLANPTNLRNGQVLNFRIHQDATGSRTLAYGSKYKFPGGTAPVLSTAANSRDFMSCQYDSTDDTLNCVLNKAFA